MLSGGEIKLLYWLARDRYTGRGEVIDAGPFLGGSTMSLCNGLEDNPGTFRKTGAVHSFDWFRYEDYFKHWLSGEALREGDSFLHVFRRCTAPFRHFVRVYEGDILTTAYEGGGVEILFVDICKSWETNTAVVSRFFPRLLPGISHVVQQDYLHYYEYWLVLTMDFFRDYFEYVGRVPDGGSVVYRNTEPIPAEMLSADLRSLPLERKRMAFERELERSSGWQRDEMVAGYARMLAEGGDRAGAREVLGRLAPEAWRRPINHDALAYLEWNYFRGDELFKAARAA
jgi:hypothetical protein